MRDDQLIVALLRHMIQQTEPDTGLQRRFDLYKSTSQDRLAALAAKGYSEQFVRHLAWILEPKTEDERIERFVTDDQPKPDFMLSVLLRRDSRIMHRKSVDALFNYLQKTVCNMPSRPDHGASDRTAQNVDWSGGLMSSDPTATRRFCKSVEALAYHFRRLSPESLIPLARLASSFIEKLSCSSGNARAVLARQTRVFNCAIQACGGLSYSRPLLYSSFNWKAQTVLLSLSASLERPFLIEKESYRAIQRVVLSMRKVDRERQVAERSSPSWPSKLLARDGMEQQQTAEDTWSRAFRAGVMMQEAGYGKAEVDRVMDLLAGADTDGSPTVHTRTSAFKRQSAKPDHDEWSARILCTRNAQEAWAVFNKAEHQGIELNAAAYREMFRKLMAREVCPDSEHLPGEGRETFPVDDSRLTSWERIRRQPPTVEQLYDRMLSKGIRPEGTLLVDLIRAAPRRGDAERYLYDSTISSAARKQMIRAKRLDQASQIPHRVYEAYISYLCRLHPNRTENTRFNVASERLEMIRSAVALARNWPEERRQEDMSQRLAYRSILRALARPNIMMSNDAPGVDLHAVVRFFIYVTSLAKRRCGIDEEMFVALTLLIRKYTSFGLRGVQLHAQYLTWCRRTVKSTFWNLVAPGEELESGSRTAVGDEPSATNLLGLGRMVAPSTLHAYLRALAFLGCHDEMAAVLELVVDRASEEAVRLMLEAAGEAHGLHIVRSLCVFRAVAEPAVGAERVRVLRRSVEDLGRESALWSWPTDADVGHYIEGDHEGWTEVLREGVLRGLEESSAAAATTDATAAVDAVANAALAVVEVADASADKAAAVSTVFEPREVRRDAACRIVSGHGSWSWGADGPERRGRETDVVMGRGLLGGDVA